MSKSRDQILNTLRGQQRPFKDAPPHPEVYLPVTDIDDISPEALLGRFQTELERLKGELFIVEGQEAARACVLDLLKSHQTTRIVAWAFQHIPIPDLQSALQDAAYTDAAYTVEHPALGDEGRQAVLERLAAAEVGLTGVDALAATTGTLIVSTGEGKTRIPSVLPPVHIAVATVDQLVPRVEDWLAHVRADNSTVLQTSANITFISGPSRTADIEKQLVLGVHGPKRVQVVLIR